MDKANWLDLISTQMQDYPIPTDLHSVTGIDAVFLYLKDIRLEQLFLTRLDASYVLAALDAYSGTHKEMIENLCSIVLPGFYQSIL